MAHGLVIFAAAEKHTQRGREGERESLHFGGRVCGTY